MDPEEKTAYKAQNKNASYLDYPTLTVSEPSFSLSQTSVSKAAKTRNNVKNAYLQAYKNQKSASVFDEIDDKTIEESQKLAKNADYH